MSARLVLRLSFCGVAFACLSANDPVAPLEQGGIHVLFVGNSLTYVNDLPATVAAIGQLAGDTIRVAMAAGADLALIDHLTGRSNAVSQLKAGGWDYVILQQGPTPAGMCRDSLVLWTQLFQPYTRGVASHTALLMTWPGATYPELFDEVRVSFQAAARAVDGVFIPAGESWRIAQKLDSTLVLYGPDGFHPSEVGTFLIALVVYERVTGHDARALPTVAIANGHRISVSPETIRLLQRVAHDTNAQFTPDSAPTADELARPSLYHSTAASC